MRFPSLLSPAAGTVPRRILQICFLLTPFARFSEAISFTPAPAANLDLSQLGRVGLAGDFDGVSLYEFVGQNENRVNTNSSQSILARYPNGAFATLASADGCIKAMCPFVLMDGTMAGIIVAGNFTSFGQLETQGVAMFNPNKSTITPLTGLSGQVSALYCDKTSNTVYVGGSFKGANSTNAVAWVGTAGWTNLPFNGFNGPISSITKSPSGHIIFGGSFTGLGNTSAPSKPDEQVLNIASGSISAGSSSATAGFSDPNNIVCKTGGADGPGNTWLLADDSPGFWKADLGFGYQPTKLRLWNTHQDGRGTKTWRYTALPITGIMNFTYMDPASGLTASCSSECPLSNNASVPYQDFHFVNLVGQSAFQIDISAWYGNGGGLNGIELFENDIFTYAINKFNEPSCGNVQAAKAAANGTWTTTHVDLKETVSDYLSITLTGANIDPNSASVVFYPDIKQSGNYSVNMYTPGCMLDNTCSSRGRVNITGITASGSQAGGFNTEIFQSNNFNKYDQIYFGYIEAVSDSFRPSITLSPSSGQNNNLTVVAQRLGFALTSTSGGLNGIFEYDPSQAIINAADFVNSTFDKAGRGLGSGSGVKSLASTTDTTYVGGNFSSPSYDNICAVTATGATSLTGGGLDAQVIALFLNGTILYVGGDFKSTSKSSTTGLSNVAAYDVTKNTWIPLGAGVNGRVFNIVPLALNVTGNTPETVITFTGNFDQILGFGTSPSIPVAGFAIWVPSLSNWLQNLNATTISITGQLSASVEIPSGGTLYAGSLSSEAVSANGVVSLGSSLGRLPLTIQPSQQQSPNTLIKRATSNLTINGVVTGLFYENNGRNLTVIGGHFTAASSNGSAIYNLALINGSNSDAVTGIGPQLSNSSAVLSLAVQNDTLFAGGALTGAVNGGSINGLVSFDFRTAAFGAQPPALAGDNVIVYSVSSRPASSEVYVGGSFTQAGSLDCPGVCVYTTTTAQWNRPGKNNLAGTANAMTWGSANTLLVGGALLLGGNSTSMAIFDATGQTWTMFNGASVIPGPVTALTPANGDASQIWVAGIATNGSTFLMKYDGSTWNPAGYSLGSGSTIRGLQILSLTQSHDSTNLMPSSQTLLLTGSLNVPGFGNASAVLFNGTTFQPYALTSAGTSGAGSMSQIFFQNQITFSESGGHLALGFIVLIGLAIALALIFLIVVAGIIAERIRRKRDGYMPAPTNMYDKASQMSRLPPEQLFGTVGNGRNGSAPMI